MTCTAVPFISWTLAKGSSNLPLSQRPHQAFYIPAGSGLVVFEYNVGLNPGAVVGNVQYWLSNGSGQLLVNGTAIAGQGTITWSLGADDPHTLYVGTSRVVPKGGQVATTFSATIRGACTQPQQTIGPCVPNPCPAGCTCACAGPTCSSAQCINCPPPTCTPACTAGFKCVAGKCVPTGTCPTCPPGTGCSPSGGWKCVCNTITCKAPCTCTSEFGTCSCPSCDTSTCKPPCTCVGNTCDCGTTPPPPASSSSGLLIGAAVVIGGIWMLNRQHPAPPEAARKPYPLTGAGRPRMRYAARR